MEFKEQTLFISHTTWIGATRNMFALDTMRNIFLDVLARKGKVCILMADESSIQRSIDRQSDIHELFNEVSQNVSSH